MIPELEPYGEPNSPQEQEYLDLVKARDGEGLFRLITEQHPYVLWGKVTNSLSEEDRRWVHEATEEAARRIGASRR